jgi:hypothetical protein
MNALTLLVLCLPVRFRFISFASSQYADMMEQR